MDLKDCFERSSPFLLPITQFENDGADFTGSFLSCFISYMKRQE
jgi:hypothetical protein